MEKVGEKQLLVLLLVVEPQLQERRHLGTCRGGRGEEGLELLVHESPVGEYLGDGGAGPQAALGTQGPGAGTHVVGVEQRHPGRRVRAKPRLVRPEHEGLEEPAGVGKVPLGRARIGHGLNDVVLDSEGPAEVLGGGPHPEQPREQGFSPGGALSDLHHPDPVREPIDLASRWSSAIARTQRPTSPGRPRPPPPSRGTVSGARGPATACRCKMEDVHGLAAIDGGTSPSLRRVGARIPAHSTLQSASAK